MTWWSKRIQWPCRQTAQSGKRNLRKKKLQRGFDTGSCLSSCYFGWLILFPHLPTTFLVEFSIWTLLKLKLSSSFNPHNQNMPLSQICSSTMTIKRWAWVLYMSIRFGQWLAMKGLKRSAFIIYDLNPAFERKKMFQKIFFFIK